MELENLPFSVSFSYLDPRNDRFIFKRSCFKFPLVAKAIFRDSPDFVIIAFTRGRVSQNLNKFHVSQEIFSCLGSFLFQFLFFFLISCCIFLLQFS